MYEVIDNLLPKPYFAEIKNITESDNFAWYWQDDQINGFKNSNNTFGFAHTLYRDNKIISDVFTFIKPIVHIFEDKSEIKVKDIFRMQINLSTNTHFYDEQQANHIDLNEDNYKSFILYLDHSDGDTVINNEHHVTPMDNKCVYFNSNVIHRATPPKHSKRRMVINTILEI